MTNVQDPFTKEALNYTFEDPRTFKVNLGYPAAKQKQVFYNLLKEEAHAKGLEDFEVVIESKVDAHQPGNSVPSIKGIKNIIAIASGKGGVGKSTTAVNLALALKYQGARVGILDADIYGPSIAKMLGSESEKPTLTEDKKFNPVLASELYSMSFGYLVDVATPAIWRGPMVTSALMQLLEGTNWPDIDYLVVDLPPGTGDIHLTLCQKVPVTGAVIVTTPQDIALIDARKGLEMFKKINVPVFGVIENMSTHICSSCGHEEAIFGKGGGYKLSQDTGVPILGEIPLNIKIREEADGGCATVLKSPEHDISQRYNEIALKIAAKLALTKKDYARRFPKIVVE